MTKAQSKIMTIVEKKGAFWPIGSSEHATARALVRAGLLRETTGQCDGCISHIPGQKVAVFVAASCQ